MAKAPAKKTAANTKKSAAKAPAKKTAANTKKSAAKARQTTREPKKTAANTKKSAAKAPAKKTAAQALATPNVTPETPTFTPDVEAAAERIKATSERVLELSKENGLVWLEAYEKMLDGVLTLEEDAAKGLGSDWVEKLVSTQADFVRDTLRAFLSALKDRLK